MGQNITRRKYFSFRDSIKLLVSFITALALKNAISQLTFITNGTIASTRPLTEVPIPIWLTFFTAVTFILRFFFGNIEYLNADPDDDAAELLIDSSTILLQSMILALTTYYINAPNLFFKYIILLLFFEIVWFFVFEIQAHIREKQKLRKEMGLGQISSLLTIILLICVGYNYPDSPSKLPIAKFIIDGNLNVGWAFGIISINLVADLYLNGGRYLDIQSHCLHHEDSPK